MKACPVIIRYREDLEVLAFQHPLAGLQLVKGTIEQGESSAEAAVRELFEEAGIRARAVLDLGTWHCTGNGEIWIFHQCKAMSRLADHWVHYCQDDQGHRLRFFWHRLALQPDEQWHGIFRGALDFLRSRLAVETYRE
jgi:8-oxo-dGTP pyrophosphatase MutT (NUDIX family)